MLETMAYFNNNNNNNSNKINNSINQELFFKHPRNNSWSFSYYVTKE